MSDYSNELLVFAAISNDLGRVHQRLHDADNVNYQCGYQGSALHQASMFGNVEIARLLLAAGADVNLRRMETGNTPLDLAVKYLHPEMAELLRRHGGVEVAPVVWVEPYDSRDCYPFKDPSSRVDALRITELPEHFSQLISECQIYCVPECRNLGAFSFATSIVQRAAGSIGFAGVIADISSLRARLESMSATTIEIDRVCDFLDREDCIGFLDDLLAKIAAQPFIPSACRAVIGP